MSKPASNLNVGSKVFAKFEEALSPELFTLSNKKDKTKQAADLVVAKPYVTMVFRDSGILGNNDHHNRLINLFKANLWAQDYAYTKNKLHTMTIETATERAYASALYCFKNSPSINRLLLEKSKTHFDFLDAAEGMALIEGAYYSRIGGDDMDVSDANKIDAALMFRTLETNTVFAQVAKGQGIDKTDPIALWQFAQIFDLTGYLREISQTDPYYARRSLQIEAFTEMNAERSIKLQKLKERDIVGDLVSRLMKQHKIDPWLVKAVDKAFKEEHGFMPERIIS